MPTLPVIPIVELSDWSDTLARIASGPLEFCEEFPRIAGRFEAWWAQDVLDRPVFIGAVNADPRRPITRRLDLLEDPDRWLEAKLADMAQLHRVGDALPFVRVDFGPGVLGALFGAETERGPDTVWTHPFIADDWSNEPDWTVKKDHPWRQQMRALLERVANDGPGRYLVCSPDLFGPADVLLSLRGATKLCMDVIERPNRVCRALDAMYPAWHTAFRGLCDLTVGRGAGLIHWLMVWSNEVYTVPACDFCCMIGPDEFERVCLPDIARQAATIGRAVFHLDGSAAARHLDPLLEVPEIKAIQYIPEKSAPSVLPWIDMFKKIQRRGRSLLINTPPEEVLELRAQLRPEGLAIWVDPAPPPLELDGLYTEFSRPYAG
ncbi:MAG TPA: hypothetical protein HPP83_10270 [Candidatus Hydrogenedentes bacterium]|nr:hypothetical protein [Candidatus Hydrogenedentota bacterium]